MTTTMSELPNELAEEILYRVPLKSVRLTCRKWNELSKTESFCKLLGAAKEGETQMVVTMNNNIHLMSLFVDKENPSIDHKGKLSLPDETDTISEIFYCEGLLACIVEYDSRFLVWNPYLGQTRWIEPIVSHHSFTYALGYVDHKVKGKSCRSLKLLYYYWKPKKGVYGYDIYDFDSDLWTTLHVTPREFYGSGVALKGNTYWCARDRNSDIEVLADGIICFDFTRERFGPLLHLPFSAGVNDIVTLSCVREEKLAVLLTEDEINPYELVIWITTKIDPKEVSWSKFLRMHMGQGISVSDIEDDEDVVLPDIEDEDVMVPKIPGSFFIDEEKKVAMAFNEDDPVKFVIIGEARYVRELDLLGEPVDPKLAPHLSAYAPSFLQIKRKETRKQFREASKRLKTC